MPPLADQMEVELSEASESLSSPPAAAGGPRPGSRPSRAGCRARSGARRRASAARRARAGCRSPTCPVEAAVGRPSPRSPRGTIRGVASTQPGGASTPWRRRAASFGVGEGAKHPRDVAERRVAVPALGQAARRLAFEVDHDPVLPFGPQHLAEVVVAVDANGETRGADLREHLAEVAQLAGATGDRLERRQLRQRGEHPLDLPVDRGAEDGDRLGARLLRCEVGSSGSAASAVCIAPVTPPRRCARRGSQSGSSRSDSSVSSQPPP